MHAYREFRMAFDPENMNCGTVVRPVDEHGDRRGDGGSAGRFVRGYPLLGVRPVAATVSLAARCVGRRR